MLETPGRGSLVTSGKPAGPALSLALCDRGNQKSWCCALVVPRKDQLVWTEQDLQDIISLSMTFDYFSVQKPRLPPYRPRRNCLKVQPELYLTRIKPILGFLLKAVYQDTPHSFLIPVFRSGFWSSGMLCSILQLLG